MRARVEGVPNFFCFCNHVTIVPPLRALLESPDLRPVVISGFEPLDVLQSVYMVLGQLAQGRCEVENQYTRVVP